jgi:hypothetical protein
MTVFFSETQAEAITAVLLQQQVQLWNVLVLGIVAKLPGSLAIKIFGWHLSNGAEVARAIGSKLDLMKAPGLVPVGVKMVLRRNGEAIAAQQPSARNLLGANLSLKSNIGSKVPSAAREQEDGCGNSGDALHYFISLL